MPLRHQKVSARSDGADPTLVQPSDWNADHAVSGGIDLPVETVSAPSAGARLHAVSLGGRALPAFRGPELRRAPLQPHLGFSRVAWAQAVGNSVNLSVHGMSILDIGTRQNVAVATTNVHTSSRRVEWAVTSASTTAIAGWRSLAAQYFLGGGSAPWGGFFFATRFGRGRGAAANATLRGFVGLSSLTGAPSDADPSSNENNAIGVCCDAGDANWQIVHRNGTATATKINTGMAKGVSDETEMYDLFLFAPCNGTLRYQFVRLSDGTSVSGTITTNLPAQDTLLCPRGWLSVGGTSSVIGLALANLYIESDY